MTKLLLSIVVHIFAGMDTTIGLFDVARADMALTVAPDYKIAASRATG